MQRVRNRMKREQKWIVTVATVLVLALGVGCSEEPTEENSLQADLPLAGLATRDTTISTVAGLSVRTRVASETSVNLLGQNGTYQAFTLIQFTQSSFPARDTALIYSATLTLTSASWEGTAGAPFGFTVHRVNQAWSPYTFTWDSIQTGLYESTSRGSYSGTITGDTATFTVDLDTAMVRAWFQSTATTTTPQYGMILIPSASTQNAIRGLVPFLTGDSSSYYPHLQVIAGSPTGPQRDTTSYALGIDAFVGTDDHPAGPSPLLYVEGGVNYRSAVRFDVSFIPRGAILNVATLYLERDPSTSKISKFVADTALAAHTLLDTTTYTAVDPENASAYGRRIAGSPYTFAFNIRAAAQSWVRGPNYGVLIRMPSASEYSTANLYTFFSPTASSPASRPRLKIIYSIRSN